MRAKLKAAGVNLGALPVDDPKAMKQLRQGIKVAERRGKLMRARESVLDYRLSKPLNGSSASTAAALEEELDLEEGQGKSEMKGDELSDTNRNLQLQLDMLRGGIV